MKRKTNLRKRSWLAALAGICLLAVGFICYYAAVWYIDTYGSIGFDAILYTLTADIGGVDEGLIHSFLKYVMSEAPVWIALYGVLLFFYGRRTIFVRILDRVDLRLYPFSNRMALLISAVICGIMVGKAAEITDFTTFVSNIGNPSALYEEVYRDPDDVQIQFPEKKRNLIYLYLESMETTFFSREEGGALDYNVIPELYHLAQENTNFSENDQAGGFYAAPGTTWTIGAIVGQTAGIPLKTPVGAGQNGYGSDGVFLPGVTTLTDILRENGYNQAIMFGSDASFGGRRQYYTTHGVQQVFDLETAQTDGVIPEGYHNNFWGMEDLYLYEYAKQKLTELAAQEEPFSFTMLTVDTHHVGGFRCALCDDVYDEQYEDVYSCASKQAVAFIRWIQQQDFFENTTIVVAGDHPSMDGDYIYRNVHTGGTRRVYNCFIHGAAESNTMKNRECSTFDMFPTTLAALGCRIEGECLGLGTNLYSDTPTLLEKLGRKTFDNEVSRYSEYYVNHFF